jgi:hypothetical protein
MQIGDYRVLTETAKDDEQIYKEKSVSVLSDMCLIIIVIIIIIIIIILLLLLLLLLLYFWYICVIIFYASDLCVLTLRG